MGTWTKTPLAGQTTDEERAPFEPQRRGLDRSDEEATHLCETRQVDQSQIQHIWRVYLEIDGLAVDALVGTGDSGGFVLDLALDVDEVVEPAIRNVVELGPLGPPGRAGGPVGVGVRI